MRKKGTRRAAKQFGVSRARGSTTGVHRIYFDGACGPVNPGGIATFGWRFVAPDGRVLAYNRGEVCRGPGATNNVAEWHALLHAVRFLAERGWTGRLHIYGDSLMVIRQLNGRWRCNREGLRRCRDECRQLLTGIAWQAIWIPREENAETDALTRQVVPGSAGPPAHPGGKGAAVGS
jgi:ribonuclease HI